MTRMTYKSFLENSGRRPAVTKPLVVAFSSMLLLASAALQAQTSTPQPSPTAPMIEITRSGSQQPANAPADHFTGSVKIEPVFSAHDPSRASGGKVTFQPGARSAWHTHPLGQTLIITYGVGW